MMNRWLDAFIPKPNEAIPGVPDWEFETIKVPTLIIRGGEKDYDHPKRTSFEVHALIKGSRLIEPPWPEDAWERAVGGDRGRDGKSLRSLGAGRARCCSTSSTNRHSCSRDPDSRDSALPPRSSPSCGTRRGYLSARRQ